ncbi:helix-turn-helix domain-containing protein [Priestia koreensis]|uniref:helix-turn-helix domain-containing protein n=1 Tax=Priestia koreensis TaxID=284581 RepID=UPI001F595D5B|nr:helix-turn-helix domain-containing protein [Priestia koreensis]UNL87548.1 helix-turn-helix domain-containing protein [Priestia koreensis]
MDHSGQDKKLLDTQEAADLLGVERASIYRYVREKKLVPVHHFKSKIYHRNHFKREDVLSLQKAQDKPGLTTGEVSKRLSIHPTTVAKYIREGKLHATKHYYNGRNLNFISEEELERFSNEETIHVKRFITKDRSYALYQPFIHPQTREFGRIVAIEDEEVELKTSHDRVLTRNELENEQFEPLYTFSTIPYIARRGTISFSFPRPRHLSDIVCQVLDRFYKEIGIANMMLVEKEEEILLDVKPCSLAFSKQDQSVDLIHEELLLLQECVIEGEVTLQHEEIKLVSDITPVALYLPSKLKETLRTVAAKDEKTMEEWILEKIYPYLEEK